MESVTNTIVTILEFVLVFGALIFLHEFGHFLFARLNKIQVEEFGFGYPPRLVKLFTHKGTVFSLNWIPFGGFVKLKGENGETAETGSFAAANPWRRFMVLLAGPVMNLLIGIVLFAVLFSRTGTPDTSKVQIVEVAANSPAETAQLQPNDIFLSVDGAKISGMDSLTSAVSKNLGKPVEISVLRSDQPITVSLTPREVAPEGEGAMGVTIANPVVPTTFIGAVPSAFETTFYQCKQLLLFPYYLIKGQISPEEGRMVSVVGIYNMFSAVQTVDKEQAAQNPENSNLNTIYFMGVLSVALGFTNLLPIPALDGGRIIFVLPEMLFKKKIKPELENKVHFIGFAVLMALMVVLVVNDIVNPVVLP